METNKRGDKRISPKWLPTDLFDYLKKEAQARGLTETAIIVEALKLHKSTKENQK